MNRHRMDQGGFLVFVTVLIVGLVGVFLWVMSQRPRHPPGTPILRWFRNGNSMAFPPRGEVGDSIRLEGSNFPVSSNVSVVGFGGVELAFAQTGPAGNFTATFVVPPVELGGYTVEVGSGTVIATSEFHVI